MATELLIDTHKFIEELKAGGFSREQAESLTRALQKSDLNHLATRSDLKELELRLTNRIIAIVGLATAFLALIKLFG